MSKYGEITWVSRGGQKHQIEEMDTGHLVNTLRGILRAMPVKLEACFHMAWIWMNHDQEWAKFRNKAIVFSARASEYYEEYFGNIVPDCMWEELTACLQECLDRGIDWWWHRQPCDCEPCKELRERNKRFIEKHPDYKRMSSR